MLHLTLFALTGLTCPDLKHTFKDSDCCTSATGSVKCATDGFVDSYAEAALQKDISDVLALGQKQAFALIGNAHSGEEIIEFGGHQTPTKLLTSDAVFRLASLTKMIGALVIGMAIEDGILSLDTKVSQYLPPFGGSVRYYVDDTANETGTYDMSDITLRDLLGHRSGFAYCFWVKGLMGSFFGVGAPYADGDSYQKYCRDDHEARLNGNFSIDYLHGSWVKTHTGTEAYNPNNLHYFERFFQDDVILPGKPLSGSKRYSYDNDVATAVLDKALEAIGNTTEAYLNAKLFAPLGITDWAVSHIGMTCTPHMRDKLIELSFQRLPGDDYLAGTGYNVSASEIAWASEFPDDGYAHTSTYNVYCDDYLMSKKKFAAWGGGGAIMSLPSFGKILKMLANKGVYGSTRLIQESWLYEMMFTPARPADEPFFFAGPYGATNHAGPQVWTRMGGVAGVAHGTVLPYPTTPSQFSWSGYWGTSYSVDPVTGYYTIGANGQMDLTARLSSNLRDAGRGGGASNFMKLAKGSMAFATTNRCEA